MSMQRTTLDDVCNLLSQIWQEVETIKTAYIMKEERDEKRWADLIDTIESYDSILRAMTDEMTDNKHDIVQKLDELGREIIEAIPESE